MNNPTVIGLDPRYDMLPECIKSKYGTDLRDVARAIIVSSSIIPLKSTRSTQGVSVFKVKGVQKIVAATDSPEKYCTTPSRYKKTKIPATGTILEEKDIELGQVSITDLE